VAHALDVTQILLSAVTGVCAASELDVSKPAEALKLIAGSLDDRQIVLKCADASASPACSGLQEARRRLEPLQELASLKPEEFNRLSSGTSAKILSRQAAYVWRPRYLTYGAGEYAFNVGVLLLRTSGVNGKFGSEPDLTQMTTTAGSARCEKECPIAVSALISLGPSFDALDRVFQVMHANDWDKIIKERGEQVARWEAYHFGGGQGRAQLPWELLLNNAIYEQHLKQVDPAQLRWPEPPKGAVVLLHPSVGLNLKTVEGASSPLVGVVELLGYSRWKYDSKTQARSGEWGASLVASYQSRDDAADWGYGALVRLPYKTLNVVWTTTSLKAGGHDDTFALTLDIGDLLGKADAKCIFKLPSCEKTAAP
jgi:hypothetical protein